MVRRQKVQSFKVKGSSGNVYLIERTDGGDGSRTGDTTSRNGRPHYRVASNHLHVNHNAADDTFRILGNDEILRRI